MVARVFKSDVRACSTSSCVTVPYLNLAFGDFQALFLGPHVLASDADAFLAVRMVM